MGKASWAQDPDVLWGAIERETASWIRPRTLVRLTLDLRGREPEAMRDCLRGVKPRSPEGPETLRPSWA